jgi:hypothetical protein
MSGKLRKELVHEGQYVVEMEVHLIDDDGPWGGCLAKEDVMRLDEVRALLRREDIPGAMKYGRVFRMMPVEAAHKQAS